MIDNLVYSYENSNKSNQLDRVDVYMPVPGGFTELVKQAGEYTYDHNGNLIKDLNKEYTTIQYNYLNLPKRVGTSGQYISYIYSPKGPTWQRWEQIQAQ